MIAVPAALETTSSRHAARNRLKPRAPLEPLRVLHCRQPALATAALIALLAIVPTLFAMLIDARTVNDINVWIKPAKFLTSFVVYYATLAWAFGYVPRAAQHSAAGKFVVRGALAAGLYEMIWLVLAAANGVPSHFNGDSPLWRAAYALAGVAAIVLIAAILVQGLLVARQRTVPMAPALRWGIVAGAVIAFGATLVTAGYLSSNAAHWVGGIASDAQGLPLLGWSRTGGDLRVAHFFSLHAQQVMPGLGLLAVALGRPRTRWPILLGAVAYVGLIVFVFVQALAGVPFIGVG